VKQKNILEHREADVLYREDVIEGEELKSLVDLELEAVNQDGLRIMPCKATVRLCSRENLPEPSEPY